MPPTTRSSKVKKVTEKPCKSKAKATATSKTVQKTKKKFKYVANYIEEDAYQGDTEDDGANVVEDCELQTGEGKTYEAEFVITKISSESRSMHRVCAIVDQENTTPPDSHSTPALARVVRRLDDSLFGFNDLVSPVPFSPVVCNRDNSLLDTADPKPTNVVTYKRQFPAGVFDIPVEVPKKKKSRKKQQQQQQEDEKETVLAALQQQFDEVEMHELAIE